MCISTYVYMVATVCVHVLASEMNCIEYEKEVSFFFYLFHFFLFVYALLFQLALRHEKTFCEMQIANATTLTMKGVFINSVLFTVILIIRINVV